MPTSNALVVPSPTNVRLGVSVAIALGTFAELIAARKAISGEVIAAEYQSAGRGSAGHLAHHRDDATGNDSRRHRRGREPERPALRAAHRQAHRATVAGGIAA